MKERPILFSAPMVRALSDGRKTQTRRVVKPWPCRDVERIYRPFQQEPNNWQGYGEGLIHWYGKCPYGQPGDQLWVREGWQVGALNDEDAPSAIYSKTAHVHYLADGEADPLIGMGRVRASFHMPRWASRIQLEIAGIRVERLQDCSVSDAIAEGYDGSVSDPIDPALKWYSTLWESINGAGSWDANPWVWVVEFKVIKP